jgi:excisionase family DNA binding protein
MTSTLTTGQVADYCRVKYWTVIEWVKSGKLKAQKAEEGGSMIRKEDFIEFLERHKLPIPPELAKDHQKRLLIVDDDKAVIDVLKELLSDTENLEIDTAHSGYEAGLRTSTFKPHVIILDLWMPGINGFEVCRHLKYNPETSNIKIIAITGYPCEVSMKKITDIGADFFLEKPIDTERLKKIVHEILNEGKTAETQTT